LIGELLKATSSKRSLRATNVENMKFSNMTKCLQASGHIITKLKGGLLKKKMKFNFKKIVSALTSTAMLGSTVALAAAAAPAPFVENGSADVAIVYGSTAAITDLVAVSDIQTYLAQELAKQTASGGGRSSGTGSGDDYVRLDKSSNRLNLGDALNGPFGSTVDDDDMPGLLADGVYTADDSDDFDFEQKITLGSAVLSHFQDSDYEDAIGASDDTPTIGINISSNQHVLNYTLDFLDDAESDIVSGDLDDLENSDLILFGNKYYISDWKNGTAANTTGKLTLLDSANRATVNEGETITVKVGDKSYDVSIAFIDSDETKLLINGKTTTKHLKGETEKLSDGSYVGITEVSKLEVSGEVGTVEFSIGSGKLEIEHNTDIQLNDNSITDLKGFIYTTGGTATTNKINKIELEWRADDDLFIAPDNDVVLPGFETIKLTYNGLVRNKEEVVTVKNDGSTSIALTAPIKDGLATVNLLYANASGEFIGVGEAADKRLATSPNGTMIYREKWNGAKYHTRSVLTYNDSTSSQSYLVSFDISYDSSSGKNETSVKNEVTGAIVASKKSGGDDFDIGDVNVKVLKAWKNASDEYVVLSAGTNVLFHTLYTTGGLGVYLPFDLGNSSTNAQHTESTGGQDMAGGSFNIQQDSRGAINISGNATAPTGVQDGFAGHTDDSWHLSFTGENKDDDLGKGGVFNITINDNSDGELEANQIDATGTGGTRGKEIANDNIYEAYTYDDVAIRTLHYVKTSGQDYMEVYYPEGDSETYAEVFLGSKNAVIGSGSTTSSSSGSVTELGSVSVSDSEVSSVSGKNLVVIGGSCVNTLASSLLGGAKCGSSFTSASGVGSGEFLIETFERSGGKVATLIAGYLAGDTTNAAKYFTTEKPDIMAGKKYKGSSATSAELVVE
jgi:hypothetical protein